MFSKRGDKSGGYIGQKNTRKNCKKGMVRVKK